MQTKIYDSRSQPGEKENITISKDFFEHLLNCLANQKFIGELPPNGDARAMEEGDFKSTQKKNQEAIDKAWRTGMFILTLDRKKEQEYEKRDNMYVDYWNKNIPTIMRFIDEDSEEFKNVDNNIFFKWKQLVSQEIEMWIRLCCLFDAIIDVDNEKYEVGQVKIDDFEDIIQRRGFTPKMISVLKDVLKHIGIGDNL